MTTGVPWRTGREWHARAKLIILAASTHGAAPMNRPVTMLLVAALFWMAAAAGFAGYVAKWGLLDESARNSIGHMLEGNADRPFVYRQFLPEIARLADRTLPSGLKDVLTDLVRPEREFRRVRAIDRPGLRFPYVAVYSLAFLSLFASLFALRRAALDAGSSELAAMLAPVALALAFPYLQTVGGYFYDPVELLFLALAWLLAARGRWFALLALSLGATLNKESFFFFLPALYPLLRQARAPRPASITVLTAMLVSGLASLYTKWLYQDNPGEIASLQLFDNFERYGAPLTWLRLESTYGLPGPAGVFIGTVVIAALILRHGWPRCPQAVREHLLIAAAINVPLVLAFAYTGELRNLSMLYVGFVVCSACALDRICPAGPGAAVLVAAAPDDAGLPRVRAREPEDGTRGASSGQTQTR